MKKYEEYVYTNFLDQRKKMKLEERLGELVRNADNKKIFLEVILQLGVINCLQLQKLTLIQYQFLA